MFPHIYWKDMPKGIVATGQTTISHSCMRLHYAVHMILSLCISSIGLKFSFLPALYNIFHNECCISLYYVLWNYIFIYPQRTLTIYDWWLNINKDF